MSSFIRNARDFWAGVIFLCFGLAAMLIGQDYSMGSAGRMGPAYFPMILSSLLVLIGVVSVIRSVFLCGEAIPKFAIKGACLIIGATMLFGVLIRSAGLPIAIIVLVMVGGIASVKFKRLPFLAVAIGMAVFSVLVFVKGLALPMPILGTWFGI